MKAQYTQCIGCAAIYKVSVTQLTICNGMVNCPRCHTDFNALNSVVSATLRVNQHLAQLDATNTIKNVTQDAVRHKHHNDSKDVTGLHTHLELQTQLQSQLPQLNIFNASIPDSNLNLRSYLNHLSLNHLSLNNSNQVLQWQKHHQPELMLSQQDVHIRWPYYVFWAVVNLVLIFILLLQVAWFNSNWLG